MPNTTQGSVASLWRYPVKSMLGEELSAVEVDGTRFARRSGVRLGGQCRWQGRDGQEPEEVADAVRLPREPYGAAAPGESPPPVRITFPDGTTATSQQADLNQILSRALGRPVTLNAAGPRSHGNGERRGVLARHGGTRHRDTVTDFALPEGTFFDCATVHLLTTATLDRLHQLYPQGRFEVPRFRPNIVVAPASGEKDFVENAWVGHTLAIGESVRLSITGPCVRCVMTTLAQGDLPRDPGILRTAAQHNKVSVGVYATVERGGTVHRGDAVRVE